MADDETPASGAWQTLEAPESGHYESDKDTRTLIKIVTGDYATLMSSLPAKGSVFEARGVRGKVIKVTVDPLKGGKAKMTITGMRAPQTQDENDDPVDDGAEETVYEVEQAQLEKPLLTKSDFSGYVEHIEAWKNARPELKAAYKYEEINAVGDTVVSTLTSTEIAIATKILKGIESYLVFAPVARCTTTSSLPLQTKGCGKRSTPPAGCTALINDANEWTWLKTRDNVRRSAKDGTYVRTEEWTAARIADGGWDTDIYQADAN